MTHHLRFVAVAVLVALVLCVPVQAQTPEIDALRVRAEAGDVVAQYNLGVMYANGRGVPQDDAEAHMWTNLAASRMTGELRDSSVKNLDIIAAKMTAEQIGEAQRRAREWNEAHPREP
jgi:hypothetical protein